MKRILLIIVIFIAGFGELLAQVSLTNGAPSSTINFSNTMQTSVGTNASTAFTGAGFAVNPTSASYPGRLNSNAWSTTGWSSGDLLFGGAMSNPAHGRGSVSGAVITEGIYAFTDNPASVANPTLMIQPADGDFSPGSITLKVKNNGTSAMTQLAVSYNLFVRNDEAASNSFNFSHSPDNVVFEQEPALDYISPDVADAFQWVQVDVSPSRQMIISGINVAPGGFYYVRWTCDNVSGSGPRDEFGIDDIVLTATYGTPAPEINVIGNYTTILDNDTTPAVADGTQFANTFIGGSSSLITYTIQNLGGADLNITNVTITGTNAADFTIQGTMPTGVIPGVSSVISFLELTIKFQPLAAGTRNAVINIFSNDASEATYNFNVRGTGVVPQPDIEVVGNTAPNTSPIFAAFFSPPNVNNSTMFDAQIIGGPGQIKDYKIKNTGTGASLILTDPSPYITITGVNPGDFSVVTIPTSNTINPGFTKTFSIKFNPTAGGIRTAIINIANNDVIPDVFGGSEGPFQFLVQGVGVAPEMDITGNSQPIVSGSVTTSFSNHTIFDNVNISTGTVDRTFTITNSGTMALTVGAPTISGSSTFTLITPPAASVAVGASTTFTVRFDPTVVGPQNAIVTIANNDTNENPYTFAISGYGVDYVPCAFGVTETIVIQEFETAASVPNWAYTTSGATSMTSGQAYAATGDGGLSDSFLGSRALQVAGATASVTMSAVNTSQYSDIELNIRIGSMSTTLAEGNDATDKAVVAVSANGGSTWSNEIEIKGSTNSKWGFTSGTGIATGVYDGNNSALSFTPVANDFVTDQGFSIVSITGMPAVSNLMVRVTMNNNSASEIWTLDNVSLFGRKEVFSIWDGTSWSNGTPTASVKAVINGNYDTNAHGNLQACKCEIKAGRTVTVQPNDFLNIQSDIDNLGVVIVENNGSLVQRNDFATNSGIINVKRHTTPMTRYDYTYWSSPVIGQTLFNLSPLTAPDKYFEFNPTIPNWQYVASSTVMAAAKGYIVRAPETFSTSSATAYTSGQFSGIANNGFIQTPILGGANAWNLIGNPYASAIDADLFLGSPSNTGVINGTIYLWTHNTPIANNAYTADDYAVYNLTGGVGTAAAQNGVNNTVPTGNIASGQGFFVKAVTNGQATFNNSMRLLGNNAEFFRSLNPTVTASSGGSGLEKHRIWLNMSNTDGAFKQTLVGYIETATNEIDRDFDGSALSAGNVISLYSLVQDEVLSIQGKALPFDIADTVKLGYSSTIASNFMINIEKTDGLFENQDIYLEDKLLGIIHDIKTSPYSFTSAAGTFNDRFELRYTTQALGVPDNNLTNGLLIAVRDRAIHIQANAQIRKVQVFDLLGRLVHTVDDIDSDTISMPAPVSQQQSLIVKTTFIDGTVIDRKIIL